jgi:hypothetical protein
MSYYWLRQDWLADSFMSLEGEIPEGIYFRRGLLQDFQPDDPVSFTTTPDGHPAPSPQRHPPHFDDGSVPAMSEHFYAAIRSVGVDNLQVWPARVRNPTSNRVWENYRVFNVIGLLDAVDAGASTGVEIVEGATGSGEVPSLIDLETMVLKKGIREDLDMFRETLGGNLIVSHRVVEALERMRPAAGWGILADELDFA